MALKYTLNIAHLYGNLMNTYGDYGNIIALKYYGRKMGVKVNSKVISLEERFKANNYDLAVFGGGQDLEQKIVSKDLLNKKIQIIKFINQDKPLVAICGGFQLLGKYYKLKSGHKIQGIGIMPHYTIPASSSRLSGNVKIITRNHQYLHGYENHQGITFLGKKEKPLGRIIIGHGNNGKDHTEGAKYKNVYCTYLHGPVLVRNPNLAKDILLKALHVKYPFASLHKQRIYKVSDTY